MSEESKTQIIQTVVGCIVALVAAVWAYQSSEPLGWIVALVGAGVIDPGAVRDLFMRKPKP